MANQYALSQWERGEASLKAYNLYRHQPSFPTVPDQTSDFEITKALNRTPHRIYYPTKPKSGRSSLAVARLAGIIATFWNSKELYAYPTHQLLRDLTELSQSALEDSTKLLRESGLFGIERGNRKAASRYYPLFHEPSRAAFETVVAHYEQQYLRSIQRDLPEEPPLTVSEAPPDWD